MIATCPSFFRAHQSRRIATGTLSISTMVDGVFTVPAVQPLHTVFNNEHGGYLLSSRVADCHQPDDLGRPAAAVRHRRRRGGQALRAPAAHHRLCGGGSVARSRRLRTDRHVAARRVACLRRHFDRPDSFRTRPATRSALVATHARTGADGDCRSRLRGAARLLHAALLLRLRGLVGCGGRRDCRVNLAGAQMASASARGAYDRPETAAALAKARLPPRPRRQWSCAWPPNCAPKDR